MDNSSIQITEFIAKLSAFCTEHGVRMREVEASEMDSRFGVEIKVRLSTDMTTD